MSRLVNFLVSIKNRERCGPGNYGVCEVCSFIMYYIICLLLAYSINKQQKSKLYYIVGCKYQSINQSTNLACPQTGGCPYNKNYVCDK